MDLARGVPLIPARGTLASVKMRMLVLLLSSSVLRCQEIPTTAGDQTTNGNDVTTRAENDGTTPAGNDVLTSARNDGTTPAGNDGTTPAGNDGTTPARNDGTTPAGNDGTTPAGNDGTTPAGNDGTTPAGNDGTTPAGNDGTTPAGNDGTTPAGNDGTTPAGNDGTTPAGNGGTTPAGNDGTTPAGNDGTTPAGNDGTTPANDVTTPAGNDGTSPAGNDVTTPAGNDGTPPAGNDGTTPVGNDGTTRVYADFTCSNGEVIPGYWVCDFIVDCVDGGDESDCADVSFTCADGATIQLSLACNFYPDCLDGSDEEGCTYEGFVCGDGTVIPYSWECDFWADCNDASDESDCADVQFTCTNGNVIQDDYQCDFYDDCGDNSDEVGCSTEGGFECNDGQVVSAYFVCDWYPDCLDESDEFGCEFYSSPLGSIPGNESVASCGGASEIYVGQRESYIWSPNYDIEQNYPDYADCMWTITAQPGRFVLITFLAFQLEEDAQCSYDFVEVYNMQTLLIRSCGERTPGGTVGLSSSSNTMVVKFHSDYSVNRAGFTATVEQVDEMVSSNYTGGWTCQSGQIIEGSYTCDGYPDCVDGSDETESFAGCVGVFDCGDGGAIPTYQLCNGVVNCANGIDEDESQGCVQNYFFCNNGLAIPYGYLCDNYIDCPEGEDEWVSNGCPYNPCIEQQPCLHDGYCYYEEGFANYTCYCTEAWGGMNCEEDLVDSCVCNPCMNDGTCWDQYDGYICACKTGYMGPDCEISVGMVVGTTVYVTHGVDSPTSCGSSATNPCNSLDHAIARARQSSTIVLAASDIPYTLENVTVTKTLTFQGAARATTHLLLDTIFTHASNEERITISLKSMTANGTVYLGDVLFKMEDFTFDSGIIQQEYMRRVTINDLQLEIQSSTIRRTIIANRPAFFDQHPGIEFQPCALTKLTTYDSSVVNSNINISSVAIQMRLENTQFLTEALGYLGGDDGLYINPGYNAEPPTRRRRSIDDVQDVRTESDPQTMGHSGDGNDAYHESASPALNLLRILQASGVLTPHSSVSRKIFRQTQRRWQEDINIDPTRPYDPGYLHRQRILSTFDDWKYEPPVRRKRAAEDSVAEEVHNEIVIYNTVFAHILNTENTNQGALRVKGYADFTIEVHDSHFINNSRAVNIQVFEGASFASVYITNSIFDDNLSQGPGAGVHIDQESGYMDVSIHGCNFSNNVAFSMAGFTDNNTDTDEVILVSQITGSGGAVGIHVDTATGASCSTYISSCRFINNTAENYGGSLYLTAGVVANLDSNIFQNTEGGVNAIRPRIGDVLESRGDLYLYNNKFEVQTAQNEIPIVSYRADSDGSFMESYELDFLCPPAYSAVPLYNSIQVTSSRTSIESLLLYCVSCNEGAYSLELSEVIVDQTDGLSVAQVSNATCLTCPYGGACEITVRAKANFWGVIHDNQVYMYLCPEGYCCQSDLCFSYNICADNREGTLCGKCVSGYSESLFSPDCISDDLCTYASSFWAVIAAYGVLYVLLFVMEGEISLVTKAFSGLLLEKVQEYKKKLEARRLAKQSNEAKDDKGESKYSNATVDEASSAANQELPGHDQEGEDQPDEEEEAAYLQIFMYYFQVPSLITIDILYQDNRDKPMDTVTNAIANIFSFNTFGLGLNTCLFQGVTAVFKIWVQTAFVLYLFVALLMILILALIVNAATRGRLVDKTWIANITLRGRFLGGLVKLLLYTYQYFATNAFLMLRCLDVASEPQSVLYIDANVACYTDWQYGVMVFTGVYVFPFFIALAYAPSLLYRRIIHLKVFIFSIILPLFGTPYLLYMFYKNKKENQEQYRIVSHKERKNTSGDDLEGSIKAVLGILFAPYRKDLGGGLCWEGMISLRRLTLVLCSTLIPNILVRHIALVVACFASLLTHIGIQPFTVKTCNVLETCSLTVLTLVSMMNLLKASYFESGNIPANVADEVLYVYDWVESVFLGLIPLILAGFVVVAILATVILFIVKKCCKASPEGRHESLSDHGALSMGNGRTGSRVVPDNGQDLGTSGHSAGISNASTSQPATGTGFDEDHGGSMIAYHPNGLTRVQTGRDARPWGNVVRPLIYSPDDSGGGYYRSWEDGLAYGRQTRPDSGRHRVADPAGSTGSIVNYYEPPVGRSYDQFGKQKNVYYNSSPWGQEHRRGDYY